MPDDMIPQPTILKDRKSKAIGLNSEFIINSWVWGVAGDSPTYSAVFFVNLIPLTLSFQVIADK